jgi:hypothetical protein
MPRPANGLLVVTILTISYCQGGTARAQIRAVPVGPIGGPAPTVRVVPIAGPTLPGGSLAAPPGGGQRLLPSGLSAGPAPTIGGRIGIEDSPSSGRSGGGMAPPSKKLESKDATEPPIRWSSGGPPPKAGPDGSGDGGDGPEAAGRPVRGWHLDVPGWVWFLAFLLAVVVLGNLRK